MYVKFSYSALISRSCLFFLGKHVYCIKLTIAKGGLLYVFLYNLDFLFVFLSGTQTINLKVTSGGPLPFAYDILTNAFQYGNRAFTQYPKEIPDYFKQTFPEGYSWERTMEFADGGTCEVKSVIRLVKYKTCSAQYLSRSFKSFSSLIYNRFHACFHALLLLDSVFLFKLCFKLELRKALFQNSFRKKETKKRKTRNFYLSFM